MELDERKIRILTAIIQNYQETGEPVGSRTISRSTDLSLSSATIRNEMADLEEMGLIVQPHTSAGRIPTDKGYRLYVDRMMADQKREVTEMKDFFVERVDRVELYLRQMAKMLAANTNYATMITGPTYNQTKLKFIQLSRVDANKLLAVVVVEGNIIKNTMLDLVREVTEEELLSLNLLLNTKLNGLTMQEINLGLIKDLESQAGIHADVIREVLDAVADAIRVDEDMQVYTSGATNIFKYPELTGGDTAQSLISTLEDKRELRELVQGKLSETVPGEGIQVYIGEEMPMTSMRDCSVVTATYDLGDGMRGTIGIIGPKRMDYEKVVGTLQSVMSQLDGAFKEK
ncbi:MAG: heat-inducible transcription repressor HrcA [Lachnospiraceae bacterium]|nr:heat-inducible transcription repressor HrcA [Lachnospiraceae bacterium]